VAHRGAGPSKRSSRRENAHVEVQPDPRRALRGAPLGLRAGRAPSDPEQQHNLAWGDDGGRTLYMTALSGVYRIRTLVPGVRP
jgi:hypothetical protein